MSGGPDSEGVPDYADPDVDAPGQEIDAMALPGDEPVAVEEFGLTADEERRGEPLSRRIAREEPEDGSSDPDRAGGRSAEEQAMHVLPEGP